MSQKITVIAKIYPKKEYYKEIKDLVLSNIEKAKREIGNLEYGLYVDRGQEHELVVLEKWETEADYKRHTKSEYLDKFNELTKGKLDRENRVELYNCIRA